MNEIILSNTIFTVQTVIIPCVYTISKKIHNKIFTNTEKCSLKLKIIIIYIQMYGSNYSVKPLLTCRCYV